MGFIRRAIIFIAQLVALVFIFISTVGGYAAGMQGAAYGVPVDPAMVGIVGAVSGFFFSLMVTAAFFALVEIAHNTRNNNR
jgi:TRAP-type C4-dicarboxylate transport system permease small subunit